MRIEIENSVFRVWRARHTLIASIGPSVARRVLHISAPSDTAANTQSGAHVCECVCGGRRASERARGTREWENQILTHRPREKEKKRATNCRLETFLEFDLFFFFSSARLSIRFEWTAARQRATWNVIDSDFSLNWKIYQFYYSHCVLDFLFSSSFCFNRYENSWVYGINRSAHTYAPFERCADPNEFLVKFRDFDGILWRRIKCVATKLRICESMTQYHTVTLSEPEFEAI